MRLNMVKGSVFELASVATIKTKYVIHIVDWCTMGFKYGINYQSTMENEDEKNKLEELKQGIELLTELMKEVLGGRIEKVTVNGCAHTLRVLTTLVNKERIMKAQMMRINLKHCIMSEVKKKAAADKSDKKVQDRIWFPYDTFLLIYDITFDEPMQTACRIHRKIQHNLSELKKKTDLAVKDMNSLLFDQARPEH